MQRSTATARYLYGYVLLHFLRIYMLTPFIPLFTNQVVSASSLVVGIVVSAFSVGPLFFAVPSGALISRYGEPRILNWAAIGDCLSVAILLLVPYAGTSGVLLLLLSQTIVGLSHLFVIVGGQHYVSHPEEGSTTTHRFGRLTLCMALGQLAGPVLGGGLIKYGSYRALFVVSLLAGLPLFVLNRSLERRRQDPSMAVLQSFRNAGRVFRGRPVLIVSVLLGSLMVFASSVRESFYPLYLDSEALLSEFWIGVVLSMFPVGMALSRLFLDRLTDVLGRQTVLLASLALATVCLLLVSWVTSFAMLLILTLGMGISHGFTQPITMLEVSDETVESSRGLAFGFRFAGVKIGSSLGPLVYGGVASWLDLRAIFWLASGVVLTGFVAAVVRLVRWRKPSYGGA